MLSRKSVQRGKTLHGMALRRGGEEKVRQRMHPSIRSLCGEIQLYRVVKNIPARFREWLSEILRHSAILR